MQLRTEEICFAQGRTARLVRLAAHAAARDVSAALGLKPHKLLLLLLGGADKIEPERRPYIKEFVQEVIRAALESEAVIIDGGTESGIMAMAGQAATEIAKGQVALIGVAPEAKVTWPNRTDVPHGTDVARLDPNHSHFVITPGSEWGAELDTIFALAAALHESAPLTAILINGGEGAKLELLECKRRNWPVVVGQGTGRLADEVAASSEMPLGFEILKPGVPSAELRRVIRHSSK